MTILADAGPFFKFCVTTFTAFVCVFFTKAFDPAPFCFGVTLCTILQGVLVNLVVKLHTSFELHYISS